jgi:hypothetical protein
LEVEVHNLTTKNGEDLDQSCEELSATKSQGGEECPTSNRKKEG